MTTREEEIRAMVREEAADWFVDNREGLSAERREAFATWLRSSPRHVEEYLGIALSARDLRVAAAEATDLPDALPCRVGESAGHSWRRRWREAMTPAIAAAAAIVTAIGIGSWWWAGRHGGHDMSVPEVAAEVATLSTRHGEQLSQRLADGSVVYLNTDSLAVVRYGPKEREVELARGQALFEVAHDVRRRFVVRAPAAEIVAMGTAFDVYLKEDAMVVTVVAGTVSLVPRGAAVPPLTLGAGQQVRVARGAWPGMVVTVDPQRATAWLRRQIVFANEPLGEVAAEFNRYASAPIVIESAALRGLPVSGTFAADNTDAFLAFLRSLEGVHVELSAARTRVWRD